MAAHTRLSDEVLTWDEIPPRTIFQHNGKLWVKLSDRYISLVVPTDGDAWLLASNPVVEYKASWKFTAITEKPSRTTPDRAALLRLRAGPFLVWLIIGGLSVILSLLLFLRSLG